MIYTSWEHIKSTAGIKIYSSGRSWENDIMSLYKHLECFKQLINGIKYNIGGASTIISLMLLRKSLNNISELFNPYFLIAC